MDLEFSATSQHSEETDPLEWVPGAIVRRGLAQIKGGVEMEAHLRTGRLTPPPSLDQFAPNVMPGLPLTFHTTTTEDWGFICGRRGT
jgi:hypothetical protein